MARRTGMALKYTAEEWEAYKPALRSFSQDTIDIAYSILVEGIAPIDVARRLDTSRQRVSLAAKRVSERLDEKKAQKLVPLLLWVKPGDVEEFKALADERGGYLEG